MSASLVGSEMCIRDRCIFEFVSSPVKQIRLQTVPAEVSWAAQRPEYVICCLLYTSDAADDM
eukprot:5633494-Alexandrium_andersonii.AAC.1